MISFNPDKWNIIFTSSSLTAKLFSVKKETILLLVIMVYPLEMYLKSDIGLNNGFDVSV